jgi:hypothetical protein
MTMKTASAMGRVVPESHRAPTGQEGCGDVAPRIGPKRADEKPDERLPIADENRKIAALFDKVVSAWGGGDAVANFLGIDRSNVSRMRSGEKAVALRHLIALFEGCPDAFMAFVRPLCDELKLAPPVVLGGPTVEQLEIEALEFLRSEDLLWKLFCARMHEVHGWKREAIEGAIVGGNK